MESQRRMYLIITIILMPFFSTSFTSATTPHPLSETATDFCNKRETTEDQFFCHNVFGSDPRSISANNIKSLLKICIDSSVKDAKNTHGFLVQLSQNKAINAVLKPVVDSCISAFDDEVVQLNGVVAEFEADPMTASYDGMLALDALRPCKKALDESKVAEPEILSRYQTAMAYASLCVRVTDAGDSS